MAFTQTATTEHPPRLVASLRNRNDFANTFGLDWNPPFGRLESEHPRPPDNPYPTGDVTYRDTLAFVPTHRHELVEDPAAVTLAADGTWRHDGHPGRGFPDQIRLAPDETVYGEYVIAGHPDGEGNGRPTGIYEFSRAQGGVIQIGVWATDHPGPEHRSTFAGMTVPPLPDADSVAWYHDADSTTPSYVVPSSEQSALPASIDFTFINHSTNAVSCGHWNLYKLHDGNWFHLGPYVHTLDCRLVLPGGAKGWTLHAFHGTGLDAQGASVFEHLGGGVYAAVAGYGHATTHSAALVELTGEPVTIVPTDDVTVERVNETVIVTSPRWADDEHQPSATLTVTSTDSADRLLIAEQVMTTRRSVGQHPRFRGLRNTLPYFDDTVDTVVLRTDKSVAETIVGPDSDVLRFRLATQSQAYRVEVDRQPEENT